MPPPGGTGLRRKPMCSRLLVSLLLAAGLVTRERALNAAAGGVPLTEAEAIRRGLARPALADLAAGEVGVARGDAIQAKLRPNPTLSYSREETHGDPSASAEDYAWLTQSLDIAGRRRLRGEAAARRLEAAIDQTAARHVDVTAEIRHRFAETLLAQRKVEALAAWARQMTRVAQTVAQREAAGEVSAYDRRRLERERAGAEARAQVERAALDRARERLAALVGEEAAPNQDYAYVTGELMPPAVVPPVAQLVAGLSERPDLHALDATASAAELDARAAGRWWLPEVTVNGGFKTVEVGSERASGFLVGASVPLPVLDRNQGDAVRAMSRAQLARGQRALELAKAIGEVRGLRAESVQLADTARRFRAEATGGSAELVRTAEAAYAGGETDILELLDAHRGALDAELQALDLEMGARRARIELDRAVGAGL